MKSLNQKILFLILSLMARMSFADIRKTAAVPINFTSQISTLKSKIQSETAGIFTQGNIFTSRQNPIDDWYTFIERDVLQFAEKSLSVTVGEKNLVKHDKEVTIALNRLRNGTRLIKQSMALTHKMVNQSANQAFKKLLPDIKSSRAAIRESKNTLLKVTSPSYKEQADTILPAQINKLTDEAEKINGGAGTYIISSRQKAVDAKLNIINEKINAISYIKNVKQPIISLCVVLADALNEALTRIIHDYSALNF
jgi:hypothetical protein